MLPIAVQSAEASWYCRSSASRTYFTVRDLPNCFNRLFRQTADVPLLRPRVAMLAGTGILTSCPSAAPPLQRVRLRTRLTLIRLALIRNPWTSGVRVSHPHCRYLCLHLLFQTLQQASRPIFNADWNAPLPIFSYPTASVVCFMPAHYPYPTARPVSCYALFE